MKDKGTAPEGREYDGTGTGTGGRGKKNQLMLQKYDIPVEHLDFTYIGSCTNAKEVERILKVLRSGEEGYFPDLEKCVADRLEVLNPQSRILRVEAPILRSEQLPSQELDDLKKTFLDWVDEIESANEADAHSLKILQSKSIFENKRGEMPSDSEEAESDGDIPIRQTNPQKGNSLKSPKGKDTHCSKTDTVRVKCQQGNDEVEVPEEPGFIRAPNPNRIKSCDYDKWDKFDADAELTKLDVEEMQQAEWDKPLDEGRLREEQELVEQLMRNKEVPSYLRNQSRKSSRNPYYGSNAPKYESSKKEKKQKSIFSKTSTLKTASGAGAGVAAHLSQVSNLVSSSSTIQSKSQSQDGDGIPDLEDIYDDDGAPESESESDLLAATATPISCASSSSILLDPHPKNSKCGEHSSKLESFLSSATNTSKQLNQQDERWRDPTRKSFIEEIRSGLGGGASESPLRLGLQSQAAATNNEKQKQTTTNKKKATPAPASAKVMEIPEPNSSSNAPEKSKPKRRFKIHIDDLNVG